MPRKIQPTQQVVDDPIRAALAVKGTRLYHYKGYYTIVVVDFFVDSVGVQWVSYFNADNCDDTYKSYDGAFIRQHTEKVDPSDLVKESFYKQNQLHVMSVDRLLEPVTGGGYKMQLDPPATENVVVYSPKHYMLGADATKLVDTSAPPSEGPITVSEQALLELRSRNKSK